MLSRSPARPAHSYRRLGFAVIAVLLVASPIEFRAAPELAAAATRAGALAVMRDTPTTVASATSAAGPGPGRCRTGGGSAPRGWRRLMSDSFRKDIRLGLWGKPGSRHEYPSGKWQARRAGAKDTGGRGTYNTMKTTSQHNGLLDVWLHSEGATRYVAAMRPRLDGRKAMRVSVCLRADLIPGYKIVYMLWPTEGPGNTHGEIDYPEAKLNLTSTANAFMHYDPEPRTGKFQDWYDGGVSLQRWHTYTIKWHAAGDYVTFHVDGRRIGRSQGPKVPDGPMIYIMQMETWPQGSLPAPAAGHVLVDWITIDVPS